MFRTDLKLLVVDDMVGMRKFIIKLLKQLGFTDILEASNGVEALEVLQSDQKVEMVFSDINMPEMTGIELLERVRADENLKKLPFVMITSELEKVTVTKALKAGATNYVTKPVTEDVLKEKLESIEAIRKE